MKGEVINWRIEPGKTPYVFILDHDENIQSQRVIAMMAKLLEDSPLLDQLGQYMLKEENRLNFS